MLKNSKKRGIATRAIHAGQKPDASTGAIMVPIFATSTYVQKSPGVHQGYEYSRTQNPTRLAYEKCIANLESAKFGFAFASGMSAADAILSLLKVGDEVDLVQIDFDNRDLIKGKVIKQFISKTIHKNI